MAGGISKLDFTKPANTPKIKNKMAGSKKIFINNPLIIDENYKELQISCIINI
jgi:hypothetical protein